MQTTTVIWLIIFLAVLAWLNNCAHKEGFQLGGGATSPGTLIQLVAKGAQDLYLTGFPVGYSQWGYGGYGYGGPISGYYFDPTVQRNYGYPWRYYGGDWRDGDPYHWQHRQTLRSRKHRNRPWWRFW